MKISYATNSLVRVGDINYEGYFTCKGHFYYRWGELLIRSSETGDYHHIDEFYNIWVRPLWLNGPEIQGV